MTDNLTFAAFDIETANPQYGSICAIGVAVVHKGERIEPSRVTDGRPAETPRGNGGRPYRLAR
ncbi:hypothetical protein [Nocardia fluminea]|uniref:hypothetical protein n=1 Tax=Nocardia fluminea TaxID=134984 RepID=UPI0033EB3D48